MLDVRCIDVRSISADIIEKWTAFAGLRLSHQQLAKDSRAHNDAADISDNDNRRPSLFVKHIINIGSLGSSQDSKARRKFVCSR
jgi:hypothetical protein